MPSYVYTCPNDHRTEVKHSMSYTGVFVCPQCGKKMWRVPQVVDFNFAIMDKGQRNATEINAHLKEKYKRNKERREANEYEYRKRNEEKNGSKELDY